MSTLTRGNIYDELSFTSQTEMDDNPSYNKLDWKQNFELGSGRERPPSKKPAVIMTVLVTVLLVYAVLCTAAVAYAFSEIVKLKTETADIQVAMSSQPNISALEVMPPL